MAKAIIASVVDVCGVAAVFRAFSSVAKRSHNLRARFVTALRGRPGFRRVPGFSPVFFIPADFRASENLSPIPSDGSTVSVIAGRVR
jgi:hypothetical protein